MSCLNNIKIGNDPISTVFHGESTGNYAQSMVFVRAQEESDREPSILFFFFFNICTERAAEQAGLVNLVCHAKMGKNRKCF